MLNRGEREASRLGANALDQALISLGRRPVSDNPDFRVTDPVLGDLPTVILDKPGAAPFRFVFGRDLDVWVGPFSEVITAPVSPEETEKIQEGIERVLKSSVSCRSQKKWLEISLQLQSEEPWRRLKVRAGGFVSGLAQDYAPYAE